LTLNDPEHIAIAYSVAGVKNSK